MKKLILAVFILWAGVATAQVQNMYSKSGDASSSWTTIQKSNYQNIFEFEIANDSTSGTDSLFIAFETDTSVTRRFYLLYEETWYKDNLSVTKIMIRSSSGSNDIPYRLRYH